MTKYVPKRVSIGGSRGPSGSSKVQVHPDGKRVRILMTEKDKNGNEQENEYRLLMADQDKEIRPMIQNGTWFVSLDGNAKKIYGIRPLRGVFKVKCDKFAAEKDKEPAPKVNNTWEIPFSEFTVLLEIVEGAEKGMIIPMKLRYWFEETIEDNKSVVAYEFHPKSRYMPILTDFCDAFGVWEYGPMPYSDNILPFMEKRVKRANKIVQITVKNGWVDSILGAEDMPDTE